MNRGTLWTTRYRISLATLLVVLAIGSLGRLYAESPSIKPDEGRPHLHWTKARQAIGKVAFISGKVIDVGRGGKKTFINFDKSRPPEFAAIISEDDLANFGSDVRQTYLGKNVCIRGMVTTYRDRPEIHLKTSDQIKILTDLPNEPAADTPPRTWKSDRIVIGTYNVLNMFDNEDDPYHADETTPAKPRTELVHLAETIRKLNADVLAMEEVENRGYLQRFVDTFLGDMGYREVVLFEGNDVRGIDVALLSRLPVGPVRSYRHVTFPGPEGEERRFSRDVLAVALEPAGAPPLEVWVVHLKSNYGGREFAEDIRLSEAKELRKLIEEKLKSNPQARFVLLGDFNDTWQSATLRKLVGSADPRMICPMENVAEEGHITYNQPPFLSMIDFILCSPRMVETYVPKTYTILPGSPETSGSDHNAVSAMFQLSGSYVSQK